MYMKNRNDYNYHSIAINDNMAILKNECIFHVVIHEIHELIDNVIIWFNNLL